MTLLAHFLLRACSLAPALVAVALLAGCKPAAEPSAEPEAAASVALKDAVGLRFLVGAAVSDAVVSGGAPSDSLLTVTHFNTITDENVLKWEVVHPAPGVYDFEPADRYMAFGEANRMFIVGHTLVWHSQTPRWVFEDEAGNPKTREALLALLEEHISTVVGRYRGRVHAWDVVNEALAEDGSLRDSPWRWIIGDDFIEKAFEFANAADPDAELYYNDYSLANAPKAAGAAALVLGLIESGHRVDGIGEQGHYKMDWPSPSRLDSAIVTLASVGRPVMITELDVDLLPSRSRDRGADVGLSEEMQAGLNPYAEALPDSMQQALADRYAELFVVLAERSDMVDRVTFWGVTDRTSWLNHWPVPGRTSYPLLFDREGRPKQAYHAVIEAMAR
jgi:endo-1,4-beta-xylanase